jgi:hypothetical protein
MFERSTTETLAATALFIAANLGAIGIIGGIESASTRAISGDSLPTATVILPLEAYIPLKPKAPEPSENHDI